MAGAGLESRHMRLFLHCFLWSTLAAVALPVAFLFARLEFVFWLMWPAIRVSGALLGAFNVYFDEGGMNLVAAILLGIPVNIIAFSLISFASVQAFRIARQTLSAKKNRDGQAKPTALS